MDPMGYIYIYSIEVYIYIYCWLHSRDLKLELSCQHNTIWPTCLPWHPSFFTLSLATCILLCSTMFSSEESLQRHDLPSFAWSQPRQSIATETVWSDWEPLEESRKIGLCLMGINHDDPWYSMVFHGIPWSLIYCTVETGFASPFARPGTAGNNQRGHCAWASCRHCSWLATWKHRLSLFCETVANSMLIWCTEATSGHEHGEENRQCNHWRISFCLNMPELGG